MKNFLNLSISSNARTNWITIILGLVIGGLGFFKIVPDLDTAQALGAGVSDTIAAVKSGAVTAIFTAVYNLYNTVSHILKDKDAQ